MATARDVSTETSTAKVATMVAPMEVTATMIVLSPNKAVTVRI